MLGYFFEESDSPWASPLTVAPKATEPFIQLCINLVKINKYIEYGHHPILRVKQTLEQLQPYKYYLDIDGKDMFHQIRLA